MAVDQHDPRVQEYLRQEEEEKAKGKKKKPVKKPFKKAPMSEAADSGKKQRRIFKRTRAGIVLTRAEVKAIKAGRKRLKKELRQRGMKSRKDLELTASTLGLYFDKRFGALIPWLLSHWLPAALALLGAMLFTMLLFSSVSHARGYFTINLTEGMFREGFVLSETVDFKNPTTRLFATPAEDVPCISISQIPLNIDQIDGQHNATYFAYTWYLRNEGDTVVDYEFELVFTAESKKVSDGVWVALFEDGVPTIYAKENRRTHGPEALPSYGINSRGYRHLNLKDLAQDDSQFELVKQQGDATWWRVVPETFVDDEIIAVGEQFGVAPGDVHKYTVVIWLEGDDPDCTDELIGGHVGVNMQYRISGETESTDGHTGVRWDDLWDDLKFWE